MSVEGATNIGVDVEKMVELALASARNAHCPHSGRRLGVCIRGENGEHYTGRLGCFSQKLSTAPPWFNHHTPIDMHAALPILLDAFFQGCTFDSVAYGCSLCAAHIAVSRAATEGRTKVRRVLLGIKRLRMQKRR